MPTTWRPIAGLSLSMVLLAACAGAAASPSPSTEPTPPPDAAFLLRITTVQALPPSTTFGWLPQLVITTDGKVLQGGAVPAIFPGPLVQPIFARQLSPNGWAKIVAAARAAGLLSGARDFTGGQMPPGSAATRLQLVADGKVYEMTGDPSRTIVCVKAPCLGAPGTPEAFAMFVQSVSDPASLAGPGELGPEQPYAPVGYAVIVGPVPDDQGLPQPPMAWPLAAGFGAFGQVMRDGTGSRCGIATGADAAALHAAFGAANQLTRWRDPIDGSFRGIQVRPLLPGDGDPCAGLVQA
jgi:hypothetical protein